ncbi:MAG: tetratricopeptide repeat protein, partial [Candidatus Cloacimonas sp.]|nr:tetratricopeptide repeat protein [Candidatus Cloacimonas sp.]
MNKWLLIAIVAVLTLSGCIANRTVPEPSKNIAEAYTGVVTKVAILPLKAMDSQSRYIQKMLSVRDLQLAFAEHPKYELMDMLEAAAQFKLSALKDVDDLDLEDMKELAEMTGCDVLVMGNLTAQANNSSYAVAMRLYSARTTELRQLNFNISKFKEERWESLQTSLIGELDKFVSTEVDKIFNIAINNYHTGNYAEAVKSLNLAMGLNPELKEANYYLGASYVKLGKMPEATEALNKNLAIEPNHQQSLNLLMDIYEQTNQPLKRLAVMEKIAAINEDETLWLAIGNLYAEQNNMPKAEAALKQAIVLEPDYAVAQSRLALFLYDANRFEESIPYLEYAFDKFPENDLISRRLAIAYQKSGRLNDAITKYEQSIKNNPTSVQPYLSVVSLYRIQASETTDAKVITEINLKAINTMKDLIKVQPDN